MDTHQITQLISETAADYLDALDDPADADTDDLANAVVTVLRRTGALNVTSEN